jgi:hypothetical protein
MKMLLTILFTLASVNAAATGNIDDMFGGGTDEFQFERFSDDNIMVEIDRDASVACNAGSCVLSSVTSNSKKFTISFNVGEGNQGHGSYGGGTYVDLGDNNNDGPRDFWGVKVEFTKGTCTQEINVPRSLYYAINRYMWGLMNEDSSVRRGFTPADEAMIIFYTTISNVATGCN